MRLKGSGSNYFYTAPAGPIAPLDILYGLRSALARGNLYMAHRCGFTARVLTGTLQAHGFATVISRRRGHPYYDLWAAAIVASADETTLRGRAFPLNREISPDPPFAKGGVR